MASSSQDNLSSKDNLSRTGEAQAEGNVREAPEVESIKDKSCPVGNKPSADSIHNFHNLKLDGDKEESDFNLSDCEEGDNVSEPETKTADPEDFVDEEALKELESTYSDDQKELIKKEVLALKEEGNEKFKNREFKESALAYTLSLRKCPLCFTKDRAILYSNRAAAKMQLESKSAAIEDCTKSIELEPTYIKPYLRRAKLYEETDKLDEALADHKKILELDPKQSESYQAIPRLQDEITARNEKMKTEMLDKLKDLGNLILRPFGLSTNNFQVNQDPNTGGYSVNFKQNSSQ